MKKRENKIIKTDILYKVVIPCAIVIMLILLVNKTLTLNLKITGVFSVGSSSNGGNGATGGWGGYGQTVNKNSFNNGTSGNNGENGYCVITY